MVILAALVLGFACNEPSIRTGDAHSSNQVQDSVANVNLVVLGTVQDAGSPHIACTRACCRDLFLYPDTARKVVCLGLMDNQARKSFLFEATPDITAQMKALKRLATFRDNETPDGIFITHAHIGHYAGLMYLGKEAMNAEEVPVFAMPRLKLFLEHNGPWDQLVRNHNIAIQELRDKEKTQLSENLGVTPLLVPHRDEYSETVGFIIQGPNKKALFIPDIDKWVKWDMNIIEVISGVDYAFIDGTFFDTEEINHRNISEIPHPFIIESMELFSELPLAERNKIFFIHFNHTNPVLNPASEASREVIEKGFNIARFKDMFQL